MVSNLSEQDLAALSTIIYSDYFLQQRQNQRLGVVVDRLLVLPEEDGPEWDFIIEGISGDFKHIMGDPPYDRQAAIDRFKDVLELLRYPEGALSHLRELEIRHSVLRYGAGLTAITFVNPANNDATVVFRGTDGSYVKWFDNIDGLGTGGGTPIQIEAFKYMEQLRYLGYNNVTVTGHSKGGNLAMYVTLFSPIISRCINFDGQGFSDNFRRRYAQLIRERNHLIRTIAAHNDFVVILMGNIAGERFFVNNNGSGAEAHYMSNILLHNYFDDYGNFTSFREQQPAMRMLEVGLDTLLFLMTDEMEDWFVDMFGPWIALALGEIESMDDLSHVLTTFLRGVVRLAVNPRMVSYLFTAIIASLAVTLVYGIVMLARWTFEQVRDAVSSFIDAVVGVVRGIGKRAVSFMRRVGDAVDSFWQRTRSFVSGIVERTRKPSEMGRQAVAIASSGFVSGLIPSTSKILNTHVDTRKMQRLIGDYGQFLRDVENVQAFIRTAENLLAQIRSSSREDYVQRAVSSVSDSIAAAKRLLQRLIPRLQNTYRGLQRAREIYIQAEQDANRVARQTIPATVLTK